MSAETLNSKKHTAQVRHVCDLCGSIINVGDRYQADFCVDNGYAYTLRTHEKCIYIAGEICDYLDVDELDRMDFLDGCAEVCEKFVCPDCKERGLCGRSLCIDKLYTFFGSYELYVAEDTGTNVVWKARKREMPF